MISQPTRTNHGPINFDYKIMQIKHLALHAKQNDCKTWQQNSTGDTISTKLSTSTTKQALRCYTSPHSYISAQGKVHRDPEAKLWTMYKVLRLSQNINDEYNNQGINSKFFAPKQKQRGG